MEYTYNLLLTISFSCMDAIVVLLVRECLGDVFLWLLRGKRNLNFNFRQYVGEVVDIKEFSWGESSVILYQDENRNEHKVCVRKKKNERIGMKCSIGVHTDKPWIAIRPEAFIPSNLCNRKMITLLLVVLGSMIFAIVIRFFDPCMVKSDTFIISIVFLLVIVICYPLMYWNHINSQEERKKVWETYEEN